MFTNNLCLAGPNGNQVSYAYFVAFISLLSNTELIKRVYLNSTQGSRTEAVTKVIQGERGHWGIYYTNHQSIFNKLSYSFGNNLGDFNWIFVGWFI